MLARIEKALVGYPAKAFFFLSLFISISGCSNDGVDLNNPAEVYGSYCFACHDTGAIGAPLLSNQAFWKKASSDMPRLYQITLQGIDAMPAKGTCLKCSDEQLKQVVDWMVQQ